MQTKVLVTGAGGFIGSHMAQYLVKKGYWVRVADMKWDNYLQGKYYDEKVTVDLRKIAGCHKVVTGVTQIYNFAANMGGIGFITDVHAEVARDNTLININMLEVIRRIIPWAKIFFSSSACVYPNYKQTRARVVSLKEEDVYPAEPNEIYGHEKLYAEELYKAYNEDCGIKVRIARFHNCFGEEGTYKDGREKAPAALCRKIAIAKLTGKKELKVWGDGKQTRSFMHVRDCVDGIYQLMQSSWSEPLNIGSDRLVAIDELARIIMKIAGVNLKIRHDLNKPQGVRGRNSNNQLCKKILGWEPRLRLEDGLKSTYRWIEKQVKKDLNTK